MIKCTQECFGAFGTLTNIQPLHTQTHTFTQTNTQTSDRFVLEEGRLVSGKHTGTEQPVYHQVEVHINHDAQRHGEQEPHPHLLRAKTTLKGRNSPTLSDRDRPSDGAPVRTGRSNVWNVQQVENMGIFLGIPLAYLSLLPMVTFQADMA